MYPIRIFWHENITEYYLEITKTRKTQQKKWTFDAHQNQYINGVHKSRFKFQDANSLNIIDRTYARCRRAAAKSDLEHHQDPTVV